MKTLKKIILKDAVLDECEMKLIRGGGTFNCLRSKENSDGSKTVFTFAADTVGVADSWAGFWNATGDWKAACFESGGSNYYYA